MRSSLCNRNILRSAHPPGRDCMHRRPGVVAGRRRPRVPWVTRHAGSDMSNPGDADATPITSIRQLADYIAAGCKPAEQFRIGTEHEKFGFRQADLAPPPYAPADGQPGSIRDLLAGLSEIDGTPIIDHGHTIGLKQGDAAISLEPAGQL